MKKDNYTENSSLLRPGDKSPEAKNGGSSKPSYDSHSSAKWLQGWQSWILFGALLLISGMLFMFSLTLDNMTAEETAALYLERDPPPVVTSMSWTSLYNPLSPLSPEQVGYLSLGRSDATSPGVIYSDDWTRSKIERKRQGSIPTNAWYQSLIVMQGDEENELAFQTPYIVDTKGPRQGLRTTGVWVQSTDMNVQNIHDATCGLIMGAKEDLLTPKIHVPEIPTAPGDASATNEHSMKAPFSPLAIELEWRAKHSPTGYSEGSFLRSPVVRGSPFSTMEYVRTTPLIYSEKNVAPSLYSKPKLDGTEIALQKLCSKPFMIQRDLEVLIDGSDHTWLIFVSAPTEFTCEGALDDVTDTPFVIQATRPMERGVVRIALASYCTLGTNPQYCQGQAKGINHEYSSLLRANAQLYPTARARVVLRELTKTEESAYLAGPWNDPLLSQEEAKAAAHGTDLKSIVVMKEAEEEDDEPSNRLNQFRLRPLLFVQEFEWEPQDMATFAEAMKAGGDKDRSVQDAEPAIGRGKLLMTALPHHRHMMRPQIGLAGPVTLTGKHGNGCTNTVVGEACPILGKSWSLVDRAIPVSFGAAEKIHPSAKEALHKALRKDLKFELPKNYARGQGDTYFSGKMLGKLARIIVIAHESELPKKSDVVLIENALERLKDGLGLWISNNATGTPFIYDTAWGGFMPCGCNYDEATNTCSNQVPNCPCLEDAGLNFGTGFYHDHHFHYGYFIYAAAVIAAYDRDPRRSWSRKHHQKVLMLIRDIANPTREDIHFPMCRHKDWFMGSSWANGIEAPNPNGRNQESSSEAVAAYEGVALYGAATEALRRSDKAKFLRLKHDQGSSDSDSAANKKANKNRLRADAESPTPQTQKTGVTDFAGAERVLLIGRVLLTTEVRAAKTYWHVLPRKSDPGRRIYPDAYTKQAAGMIWSNLVQFQTWFGMEPWKCYGIQIMPITAVSETLLERDWIKAVAGPYRQACTNDKTCSTQGWMSNVIAAEAASGYTDLSLQAVKDVDAMQDVEFVSAGGNGHSRTNLLWWIATRPRATHGLSPKVPDDPTLSGPP
jgi:endo-1,3(4)-beta-glucanase